FCSVTALSSFSWAGDSGGLAASGLSLSFVGAAPRSVLGRRSLPLPGALGAAFAFAGFTVLWAVAKPGSRSEMLGAGDWRRWRSALAGLCGSLIGAVVLSALGAGGLFQKIRHARHAIGRDVLERFQHRRPRLETLGIEGVVLRPLLDQPPAGLGERVHPRGTGPLGGSLLGNAPAIF